MSPQNTTSSVIQLVPIGLSDGPQGGPTGSSWTMEGLAICSQMAHQQNGAKCARAMQALLAMHNDHAACSKASVGMCQRRNKMRRPPEHCVHVGPIHPPEEVGLTCGSGR